jgi:hypothetical protein
LEVAVFFGDVVSGDHGAKVGKNGEIHYSLTFHPSLSRKVPPWAEWHGRRGFQRYSGCSDGCA